MSAHLILKVVLLSQIPSHFKQLFNYYISTCVALPFSGLLRGTLGFLCIVLQHCFIQLVSFSVHTIILICFEDLRAKKPRPDDQTGCTCVYVYCLSWLQHHHQLVRHCMTKLQRRYCKLSMFACLLLLPAQYNTRAGKTNKM